MFALHQAIVLPRFFKSGAYAARAQKNAVSFWELFLWGSCAKEKSDKRYAVTMVCGAIYKKQNPVTLFLLRKKPQKKKLCKKKKGIFAYAAGATFWKRWTKTFWSPSSCEQSARQIKIWSCRKKSTKTFNKVKKGLHKTNNIWYNVI